MFVGLGIFLTGNIECGAALYRRTVSEKGGDMRVLVVEDEALIGLGLEDELTKAGHVVAGPVPSTGAALLLVNTTRPTLALIDLDLSESQDPVRLARVLKNTFRIPTLFMTCQPQRADAYSDAAIGVLSKPFDLADIPAAIDVANEVLAGGDPPPPPLPAPLRLFN
jgi:DNA-binding response OmpR family regulator